MASMLKASPRILSIQSHVVSGYCGNKSATFPLQLLEFEVDVLNSVQLSNHTQYQVARGQIFGSKNLEEIHSGLKANNILPLYDHILSGYVADVSYIESMTNMIKDIKSERLKRGLDCWYTLDPVLGDDGVGYYVPGGSLIADAYRKNLLPLADIITPNRFEASILSGVEIDATASEEIAMTQAMKAIDVFHKVGVQVVVLTSFETAMQQELTCILSHDSSNARNSTLKETSNDPREVWVVRIPKLGCQFTGTGDLFAALITAWLKKTDFDLRKSFENTVNSIHQVLEDTLAWYRRVNDGTVQSYELRLVQNKMQLMCPKDRFIAEKLQLEK